MTNPLTPILDQLTKQAVMHFRPEDVSRVHRVCQEVVRGHRVTVDLPLPAWDSLAMGVAFRRVDKQNVKGEMRKFKRTASFVLEGKELEQEGQIRAKAAIALGCILQTVLCQIREVKPARAVSEGDAGAGDGGVQFAPEKFDP